MLVRYRLTWLNGMSECYSFEKSPGSGALFFVLYFSAVLPLLRILKQKKLMIHIGRLPQLMERLDKNRRRIPFSCEVIVKSGERIKVDECVCTSIFSGARSANLMFLPSMEVRKVYIIGIVRFNDEEVYV